MECIVCLSLVLVRDDTPVHAPGRMLPNGSNGEDNGEIKSNHKNEIRIIRNASRGVVVVVLLPLDFHQWIRLCVLRCCFSVIPTLPTNKSFVSFRISFGDYPSRYPAPPEPPWTVTTSGTIVNEYGTHFRYRATHCQRHCFRVSAGWHDESRPPTTFFKNACQALLSFDWTGKPPHTQTLR